MQLPEIIKIIKADEHLRKPVIIGVDGYGGSGKTTIAKELALELGDAHVVSMDDFIIKSHLLDDSWEESFDRVRIETEVLKSAISQRAIAYRKLLWDNDTLSESIKVPEIEYLIIEGITSTHPSINEYYDYKIWVNVPIEVAKSRGILRDKGNENEQNWDVWSRNDLAYQTRYHPEGAADFVIVNANNR